MRRLASLAIMGLAFLVLFSTQNQAREAPATGGTWKLSILTPLNLPLMIIKVGETKGEPTLEIVSTMPQFKSGVIKDLKVKDGVTSFTFKGTTFPELNFKFQKPRDGKGTEKRGFLSTNGNLIFAILNKTEEKEVGQPDQNPPAVFQQFFKAAFQTRDPKEKEKLLKEILAKHEDDVLGYNVRQILLDVAPGNGAAEAEVKSLGDKLMAFASSHGPEFQEQAVRQVSQKMVNSKKFPELALNYARIAEKSLPPDATPSQSIAVLKPLLSALKQAKKEDEIKEVSDRVASLEKRLDEEFEKNAVPFKTEEYTRPASKNRVVLLELFTGAQCPPCVAADIAFDAALKTYKPKDVVLLQYHLHVPGPDALTNPDTEKRSEYYAVQGVPTFIPNGGNDLGIGGPRTNGKLAFDTLVKAIKEPLEADEVAKLQVSAEKSGDTLAITANVSDLKDAGNDTKLRFALVEESVRYPGNNGQRFHHHIVRAMPGGADGFVLKEAKTKKEVKVNLAELKKELVDYLVKANEKRAFLDDERPLDLKNLKVVAFIQNDKSKEILQVAQIDIK